MVRSREVWEKDFGAGVCDEDVVYDAGAELFLREEDGGFDGEDHAAAEGLVGGAVHLDVLGPPGGEAGGYAVAAGVPTPFLHAGIADDLFGGCVGDRGRDAVPDGGYLGVAGVADDLVDLFHAGRWFADAEDAADGAGVAPIGGAVFVVDEVAVLHDALGGEAVGVDGALAADEVHGAGGEVAEVGDHGAVHFGDDFELGLAGGEDVDAGLVDGVVDVGGFADVDELGGGLDELELFDKAGGLGD